MTLFDAFFAGVLSFISPCVVPLIPGYLAFISTASLEQLRLDHTAKRHVLITSILFIFGFSLVFVALGASATYLGQFLMERLTIFGKIAGVLLIVLGLHAIGLFKKIRRASMIGAAIVGISFAFGWTPSISPTLAAILAVASQQDSVDQGVLLLSVYSLGLAIPFLLTALAINQFFTAFGKIRRYYHTIEIVSGLLMIIIGVLIFTNRFTIIAQWLSPYLPTF